jgi:hypothetical protein
MNRAYWSFVNWQPISPPSPYLYSLFGYLTSMSELQELHGTATAHLTNTFKPDWGGLGADVCYKIGSS